MSGVQPRSTNSEVCGGSSLQVDHPALRERAGMHLYRQRMNIQLYHAAQVLGQGRTHFHPENAPLFRFLIRTVLKATGLYRWGYRNACDIRICENCVTLRRLPDSFIGFRILHLSDLHLDLDRGITDAMIQALQGVQCDICVITGDFRGETWGDSQATIVEMERLRAQIDAPVYAVLGNHDFLELTSPLEKMGVSVLLNEHRVISHPDGDVYLAGLDDPHFYATDNLEKTLEGVAHDATTILLSHTAEPYRQICAAGVDLLLCGHTHGGQICLPGGVSLMHNAYHPRAFTRGAWGYKTLVGYTSPGTGACLVPVRYFCPPEVTMHILHRR